MKIIDDNRISLFKKYLSTNVNTYTKSYSNKDLILSYYPIKRRIGFISSGRASIVKTDIHGDTHILKELKENDIFSNLFFQDSKDEIFIISRDKTEVIFIDYYNLIKNTEENEVYFKELVLTLFDLLINDNKEHNEKIELLSRKTVREKITFFLKKRLNKNSIFKVTTSYTAIAEYISVDRSNLMRELKKMEDEGIIKKNAKEIHWLK